MSKSAKSNSRQLFLQVPEDPGTKPVRISDGVTCGGKDIWIIAGPCAVESMEQLVGVAETLQRNEVQSIRGGVFKPRTSPYAFQGMGEEGLKLLADIRSEFGLSIVTEVMSETQIDSMVEYADVLQVGSRNMQNFNLLKALGETRMPILLKRGLAATIDEFLWAAEYILAGGNEQLMLCERGIRSFDTTTRNVLDLGGVSVLKRTTHCPVVVDPSHAAGRRDIIVDLARAAIAVGADGLMVEIHPEPDRSVSDAQQALSLDAFDALMEDIRPIANAMNRHIGTTPKAPKKALAS